MKKIYLVLATMLASYVLVAASLQVNNPYSPYWNAQTTGNIDSVAFDISRQGMVTKFEMTIAFASPSNYYNADDTLEVIYYFDLPKQTILTDAWLWIDGKQKPAALFSKGTAINTYEDIVRRVRRDPLLLYKYDCTSSSTSDCYVAKIFPMQPKETRCIKISCLIPSVSLNFKQLLNNVLVAGNKPDLVLRIHDTEKTLTQRLNYATYSTQAGITELLSVDTVVFSSSLVNKNQYYACSINAKAFLGIPHTPQKTIFVIDSALSNNDDVLNEIQSFCTKNTNKSDSVYFISPSVTNSRWISISSSSIKEATNVFIQPLSRPNYNELLYKAFTLQRAQKENCRIVFLSSAFRSYYTYLGSYYYVYYGNNNVLANQALELYNLLKKESFTLHDFYILDLDVPSYLKINNTYYSNPSSTDYYKTWTNSYTQTLSSKIPGGVYSHFGYKSIATNLQDIYKLADELVSFLTCRIDAHKGLLYAQYDMKLVNTERCIAVGQGRGVDTVTLQVSGLWHDSVFARTASFAMTTKQGDTTSKNIWAGVYIQNLESISPKSSLTEKEIIANSLQFHVLSKYSAFLALEDGLEVKTCENCPNSSDDNWNRPILTPVGIDSMPKNQLHIYPNPFVNEISVSIADAGSVVRIELRTSNGELISTIAKENVMLNNIIQTSSLTAGLYFVAIIYEGKTEYRKVVKI